MAAASRSPRRHKPSPDAIPDDPSPCPYEVLGVALVVDQLGKGARMVFRYPAMSSSSSRSTAQQHQDEGGGSRGPTSSDASSSSSSTGSGDDLFFRLPSRQMAKLFRPKPALCGQPMTLTVGGTVFICCSTLMEPPTPSPAITSQQQQQQDGGDPSAAGKTAASTTTTTNPSVDEDRTATNEVGDSAPVTAADSSSYSNRSTLVLFSVIVALVAPFGVTSFPLSTWRAEDDGNRGGGAGEDRNQNDRPPRASGSLLAIRRAHVSLSRLCRVLAREERRCRYVSLQAENFQAIRSQLQRRWKDEAKAVAEASDRHGRQSAHQHGSTLPHNLSSSLAGGSSVVAAAAAAMAGSGSMSNGIPPGPGTNSSAAAGAAAAAAAAAAATAAVAAGAAAAAASAAEPRKRGHRKGQSFGRGDNPHHEVSENAGGSATAASSTQAGDDIIPEVEQEVVEVIMASRPAAEVMEAAAAADGNSNAAPGARQGHLRSHWGNLARELAQVFHALGRNGNGSGGLGNSCDLGPSPTELLTGKSGVVYVNRHIAVPIEPLSEYRPFSSSSYSSTSDRRTANIRSMDDRPDEVTIRPYHTLLFPLATPEQLLEGLQASSAGSADLRRLQQLLLASSPRKGVAEMSSDANLPLATTIELASYLVGQGACVVSPVLSRNTQLVCCGVDRIRNAALPFAQAFGPSVNVFALVSFLTRSGRTLGDAMREVGETETLLLPRMTTTPVTPSDPRPVALLREGLESSLDARIHMFPRPVRPPGTVSRGSALADAIRLSSAAPSLGAIGLSALGQSLSPTNLYGDPLSGSHGEAGMRGVDDRESHTAEQLEDVLFQMATWLRSRHVLNHLVEFLVACLPLAGGRSGSLRAGSGGSAPAEESDDDHESVGRRRRSGREDRGSGDSDSAGGGKASEKKVDGRRARRRDRSTEDEDDDEALFRELFEAGCLDGHSSLPYCCYRLGLDSMSRLRAFAHRHPRLRIVTREPTCRDDW